MAAVMQSPQVVGDEEYLSQHYCSPSLPQSHFIHKREGVKYKAESVMLL